MSETNDTSGRGRLDVCIVGAGPAGLNAALILGRCRRRVIVLDSGRPRNGVSRGLHGYLTRDGVKPIQLRELGRADLERYPTVAVRDMAAAAIRRDGGEFVVTLADGSSVRSRILLLATGRLDLLPEKPGFRELFGRGVYHCPICDGWEHCDQPMVAYGNGGDAAGVALELLTWSSRVTLCTDGSARLPAPVRERLARHGVGVCESEVLALRAGPGGFLEQIAFADGNRRECGALFFDAVSPQQSRLGENLGVEMDESGAIRCNVHAATNVPGLYVAGNVRRGIHLAITAAAEGAEAGLAINDALIDRDFG